MSQAEAQNIITYVGVPLAVLGVLPTLSTTVQSLLTQRAIRRTLNENGVQALTRSSLLSGIVEIEIPRLSIQPLDRNDPAYWKLRPRPSSLRGGSWSIFYWNEMAIGSKSYRLQYHDELIQPQAEIPLEALVAFLLDRGAVPYPEGLADLRSSGLWTPAGTRLLLSPSTSDAVLMVARSDDSDGILSLSMDWQSEWDLPSTSRLSPYWVRIRPGSTRLPTVSTQKTEGVVQEKLLTENVETNKSEKNEDDVEKSDVGKSGAEKSEIETTTAESSAEEPHLASPIRLRISANGVEQAYDEDEPKVPLKLSHFHNANPHVAMSATCLWFNIACTALAAPSGGLWSFAIPPAYIAFSHRESLPCGVLVLLGLLSNAEVPAWHSSSDELERLDREEEDNAKHVQWQKRNDQIFREMRMKPEEAARARMDRMKDEMMELHEEGRRERLKMERRQEQKKADALTSPRIGTSLVGKAALKWLINKELVSSEVGTSLAGVVEKCVYDMIEDQGRANDTTMMLENWRIWTEGGGMTRANFDDIGGKLETFCYAVCILALVKETSAHPTGSVVSDLQDCLRMWKKVRLG